MAIKKEMKAWAVKLRGRNFWLDNHGAPCIFATKKSAEFYSSMLEESDKIIAKPVRVKVLVEEV